MDRRELIQRVVVGGTVLVLAPSVLPSCTKDPTSDPGGNPQGTSIELDLTLPAYSSLNSAGGSVIVQRIIVINTDGSHYVALSSICTHQGCTLAYNSGTDNLQCPCHGSVYTTSGSVVSGPAPRSLQTYPVSKTGNILSISL
jgi:cytochrome b6-f complex iron-sulfur subunit